MKICIGIPSPQWILPNFAFRNLPDIIATAKAQLKDLEIFITYKEGVMTSSNRNWIIEKCLDENIDAILWLDTDMVYPADIVPALWNANKDIIGSVYFKRTEPYDPVVYKKSKNKVNPYGIIDPLSLTKITEVDGVGFGGMMVRMRVHKHMAKKGKWLHYGRNFGIPTSATNRLSHDLQFCKEAQKEGFKIYVHPQVRCGHMNDRMITYEDWQPNMAMLIDKPKIAVLLPSIDLEKANKTIKQLQSRASYPAEYYILEDKNRSGFMKTINTAVKKIKADYYVYCAEDSYGGRNWLYHAIYTMLQRRSGLFAFNDGKNAGNLATFGMVEKNWMKRQYGGDLFYSGYNSHYGDTELTVLAKSQGKLSYNPNAVLVEVDYNKHGVNLEDKKLYNKRKLKLFIPEFQQLFK